MEFWTFIKNNYFSLKFRFSEETLNNLIIVKIQIHTLQI